MISVMLNSANTSTQTTLSTSPTPAESLPRHCLQQVVSCGSKSTALLMAALTTVTLPTATLPTAPAPAWSPRTSAPFTNVEVSSLLSVLYGTDRLQPTSPMPPTTAPPTAPPNWLKADEVLNLNDANGTETYRSPSSPAATDAASPWTTPSPAWLSSSGATGESLSTAVDDTEGGKTLLVSSRLTYNLFKLMCMFA